MHVTTLQIQNSFRLSRIHELLQFLDIGFHVAGYVDGGCQSDLPYAEIKGDRQDWHIGIAGDPVESGALYSGIGTRAFRGDTEEEFFR